MPHQKQTWHCNHVSCHSSCFRRREEKRNTKKASSRWRGGEHDSISMLYCFSFFVVLLLSYFVRKTFTIIAQAGLELPSFVLQLFQTVLSRHMPTAPTHFLVFLNFNFLITFRETHYPKKGSRRVMSGCLSNFPITVIKIPWSK